MVLIMNENPVATVEEIITLSSGCVLEPWFAAALRHPFSKQTLTKNECHTVDGILDFRLELRDAQVWKSGQAAYEAWADEQIRLSTIELFQREVSGVRPVYDTFPIKGACLDVGGLDGRVRTFMAPEQRYACVDPYLSAISDINLQPNLTAVYPELTRPVNFVCGVAEHLPIADRVFDTVHMRSVIDHMYEPERALSEAGRVLKPDGQIIVGVSVEGGERGILSMKERAREMHRFVLVTIGFEKYRDHHVWHPTWPALKQMIENAGFTCVEPYWQNARVVYVRALKSR
jgi:SAM-dependent methyltransferase